MRDKSIRQPRDVEMLLGVSTLAVISSRNPEDRASVPTHLAPLFGKVQANSGGVTAR
jgi:hypothetical protein